VNRLGKVNDRRVERGFRDEGMSFCSSDLYGLHHFDTAPKTVDEMIYVRGRIRFYCYLIFNVIINVIISKIIISKIEFSLILIISDSFSEVRISNHINDIQC
jgi:hypothetical protein